MDQSCICNIVPYKKQKTHFDSSCYFFVASMIEQDRLLWKSVNPEYFDCSSTSSKFLDLCCKTNNQNLTLGFMNNHTPSFKRKQTPNRLIISKMLDNYTFNPNYGKNTVLSLPNYRILLPLDSGSQKCMSLYSFQKGDFIYQLDVDNRIFSHLCHFNSNHYLHSYTSTNMNLVGLSNIETSVLSTGYITNLNTINNIKATNNHSFTTIGFESVEFFDVRSPKIVRNVNFLGFGNLYNHEYKNEHQFCCITDNSFLCYDFRTNKSRIIKEFHESDSNNQPLCDSIVFIKEGTYCFVNGNMVIATDMIGNEHALVKFDSIILKMEKYDDVLLCLLCNRFVIYNIKEDRVSHSVDLPYDPDYFYLSSDKSFVILAMSNYSILGVIYLPNQTQKTEYKQPSKLCLKYTIR